MSAVSLLSGGLDSTVATVMAHRSGGVELALTIDYRQRSSAREVAAARAIASSLSIRHRIVRLDFLSEVTTSALIDQSAKLPFLNDQELNDAAGAAKRSMHQVWVPNRNGLMISVAASFAEGLGASDIVVGFNLEEAATFSDNSAQFLARMNDALALSTQSGVRVHSPTLEMVKEEIVRVGYEMGAPMGSIWSCYQGGNQHCWSCESCRRLRRALTSGDFLERFEKEATKANDA